MKVWSPPVARRNVLMVAAPDRIYRSPLHPLHAILLAAAIPLFLGALLSDIAYSQSYQIQWKNFASWLIQGGLLFGGFALLWAAIELFRADRRGQQPIAYFLVLLIAWVLGFINAFIHAKDAWASMPAALIISAIVAVLTIAAAYLGFMTLRAGGVK
jgi:uncharacterized membrane protein